MSKRVIHFILIFILFNFSLNIGPLSSSSPLAKNSLYPNQDDIRRILEDHFKKFFQNGKNQIEIKEVRVFNPFPLVSAPHSYEILLSANAYRGGSISATILFYLSPDEVKRVRVTAKVEIHTEVIVTTRYLSKNHIIEESDVKLVYKNFSPFPSGILTKREEVIGKRTTVSLNPGEILKEGMLDNPPIIRKGDHVTLLIETPKFRITALAEAKEEGGKGEKIRLVNLTTKKEVSGRVLDSETVEIDF